MMKKLALALALVAAPTVSSIARADEVPAERPAGEAPKAEGGDKLLEAGEAAEAAEQAELAKLAPEQREHAAEAAERAKEARESAITSNYVNWFDFGWLSKDYYGGAKGDGKMAFVDAQGKAELSGEGEEKMSPPFVLMLLNFGIFLLILNKYLKPAGHKLAEERHDAIKKALHEAADLRKQAEERLAEYGAKLAKADAEIAEMVTSMKASAEADKARMLATAEAQAAQMKRDAELRIAAEIEHARALLTKEVTAAAAAATEKILREKATADDQNKLVTTFITGVQSAGIRQGDRP